VPWAKGTKKARRATGACAGRAIISVFGGSAPTPPAGARDAAAAGQTLAPRGTITSCRTACAIGSGSCSRRNSPGSLSKSSGRRWKGVKRPTPISLGSTPRAQSRDACEEHHPRQMTGHRGQNRNHDPRPCPGGRLALFSAPCDGFAGRSTRRIAPFGRPHRLAPARSP